MPPPPSRGGNGIATAALIVGIISLVLCFTFVGGVAAIVLGAIGLNRAKQLGGLKKGQALAGMIMGALSIAIGIGFFVVIARGADKVGDELNDIGGPASSSSFDVTVEECNVDEFGSATASGELTNTTDEDRNFEIEVEFKRDDETLDAGSTLEFDIPAGDSRTWTVPGSVDDADGVECAVTGVNNILN